MSNVSCLLINFTDSFIVLNEYSMFLPSVLCFVIRLIMTWSLLKYVCVIFMFAPCINDKHFIIQLMHNI